MFCYKIKKIKKNGEYKNNFLFISGKKRILYALNLLKNIILLEFKRKKKNFIINNLESLYKFIIDDKTNKVLKIKFFIYKKKLNKMYC